MNGLLEGLEAGRKRVPGKILLLRPCRKLPNAISQQSPVLADDAASLRIYLAVSIMASGIQAASSIAPQPFLLTGPGSVRSRFLPLPPRAASQSRPPAGAISTKPDRFTTQRSWPGIRSETRAHPDRRETPSPIFEIEILDELETGADSMGVTVADTRRNLDNTADWRAAS